METDVYKTIEDSSEEILFKDKNSKFFGYAFSVLNEDDVKNHLDDLKKKHHTAGHFCYAYQIGVEDVKYRANDDGEPNNSAGMPIYGQIQSFEVTNILIVVVRYFGGTKLGVSGLINAYKTAAQQALEASKIIEKTIDVFYEINFEYDVMNKVMRVIKEKDITLVHQKMELACKFIISIRKNKSAEIFELFNRLYKIEISELEP